MIEIKTATKKERAGKRALFYIGIGVFFGIISGRTCTAVYAQPLHSPKKPNIIFIMSDDHAAQAISAYGGIFEKIAPTPNIDRLAREGVKLNNVFCTNAICGPSRASILTGKYSHINGFYKNEHGGAFDNTQWTFPKALQNAGYTTALFGKWHLTSAPTGFDFYKYHDDPSQQGTYWDPLFNENGKMVSEKGYATNLTADFALAWLKERENADQPFCLMIQFKAPHREWAPDSQHIQLFGDKEMPYPIGFDDQYQTREKTAGDTYMTMDYFNRKDMKISPPPGLTPQEQVKWNTYGNKPGQSFLPREGMTQEEARKWKYQRYIKDYLACVRSVDDNVGRVLDYLKQHNLEENTIVIYTSDQGFFLGEHGFFDKRFMYEESSRMPFLIRYKNVIPAGKTNQDIITNIDFAPTLLEMAGFTIPEAVQGRSFFSNLKGKKDRHWPAAYYYHYYEYPMWHHVQPHYGIRNQRYKLIHYYYNMDTWEFFDLKKDPHEMSSEANNPKYAKEIAKMKNELQALMKKYGNNKSLDEFRIITDKNFGGIGTKQ